MSNCKEPAFTVVDKRGQNHAPTLIIETPPPETAEEQKSKRIWKSQGLMIVPMQGPYGLLIAGRAVGTRQDGVTLHADYIFPPVWSEHEDWVKKARRRLNTFLGCDCKTGHPCHVHQIAGENWMKEDIARLQQIQSQPLPECIESMMKAAQLQAKQSLVLPR